MKRTSGADLALEWAISGDGLGSGCLWKEAGSLRSFSDKPPGGGLWVSRTLKRSSSFVSLSPRT